MNSNPTILVVEDDVALAEITCEFLTLGGVKAVYRTTIQDAIDYLAGNVDTTIALFTDINLMSPMGGIELAVYVAEEWPAITICVTSGLSPERPKRLPEKATFMAKPWTEQRLVAFAQAAAKAPRD